MKKKVDFFMPLYIGDYLADTSHLGAEEHGAYLLLLMAAWKRDGRLPNDPTQLARMAAVSRPRWPRVWGMIAHFFQAEAGELVQPRLLRELARAARVNEAASRGGKASAQTRAARGGSNQPKPMKTQGRPHKGLAIPFRRVGQQPQPQQHPQPDLEGHTSGSHARASGAIGASVALVRAQSAVAALTRRSDERPTQIESAPQAASVATTAPRVRVAAEWEGHRWISCFGQVWCRAKGTIAYGRGGVADTRAAGDLMEMLGSLPADEVLAIQGRAGELFEMFLAEAGKVAEAEHPFSWFVARLNGYRARMAKRDGGMGNFSRSEMPEGA